MLETNNLRAILITDSLHFWFRSGSIPGTDPVFFILIKTLVFTCGSVPFEHVNVNFLDTCFANLACANFIAQKGTLRPLFVRFH